MAEDRSRVRRQNDDRRLHVGTQADERVKKRRRTDKFFKARGLAAILFALASLLFLLFSIGNKAYLALTVHYINVDLEAPVAKANVNNQEAIWNVSYRSLIKKALRSQFPSLQGRRNLRQLTELVSSGSGYDLSVRSSEDPLFAGSGGAADLLADDLVDLYLKDVLFPVSRNSYIVDLQIKKNAADETLIIHTNKPIFSAYLAAQKQLLKQKAKSQQADAELYERGYRFYSEKAGEENTLKAHSYLEKATLTRERSVQLMKRANASAGSEAVDKSGVSVLLRVGHVYFKARAISDNEILAFVLLREKETVPLDDLLAEPVEVIAINTPEIDRKLSDLQISLVDSLTKAGKITEKINWNFLTGSDSREAERAAIGGAILGSALTMLITMLLTVPVGSLAAVYLEEFAPKNRFTAFIDLNINNLAAVPSIIFGLVGLTVIIGIFGVPRSTPLVGGIVLALMSLPTIVIASRASIRAVPPSVREGALGVGASHTQMVFHHVFPLALPGILTGSIIAMAQALGETAPLILIGMVAFIIDSPAGFSDPAAPLPVLIYRWSDLPEQAFEARAAAAIAALLLLLIILNAVAVYLRNRFEIRW